MTAKPKISHHCFKQGMVDNKGILKGFVSSEHYVVTIHERPLPKELLEEIQRITDIELKDAIKRLRPLKPYGKVMKLRHHDPN